MKKLLSILLTVLMTLSLCACSKKELVEVKTLNNIKENEFETSGYMSAENVFALQFKDEKGEVYIAVVKIPDDRIDAFDAVKLDEYDNTLNNYLSVIGDLELTDKVSLSEYEPSAEILDSYKGMSIAEFESMGFYMSGYSGIDGKYSFDFDDDLGYYNVELEDVTLPDLDDTYAFDDAIQDLKINKITFIGLSTTFIDGLLEQYLDKPEAYVPSIKGDVVSSLDDINEQIGANLKSYPNASDEQFGIDGDVGEYLFKLNDKYCAIRVTKNLTKAIIDFEEGEDNLQDEDGSYITYYSQTDVLYSVRFVQNDIKYAFIVFDGNLEWNDFEAMSNDFRECIAE